MSSEKRNIYTIISIVYFIIGAVAVVYYSNWQVLFGVTLMINAVKLEIAKDYIKRIN